MKTTLNERLNQIEGRITEEAFLSGEGIGNEIACYIFDYPARDELRVREHVEMMVGHLASHHSKLDVLHLNLFDIIVAYLEHRNLFDKALKMQATKGDAAVLKALRGPLSSEKICKFIAEQHRLAERDLILISGVGSAWPLLRAHGLLNGLHAVLDKTPLVLFYPGSFDGTTLRLFGQIATTTSKPGTKPYYRAFRLIPGGNDS